MKRGGGGRSGCPSATFPSMLECLAFDFAGERQGLGPGFWGVVCPLFKCRGKDGTGRGGGEKHVSCPVVVRWLVRVWVCLVVHEGVRVCVGWLVVESRRQGCSALPHGF